VPLEKLEPLEHQERPAHLEHLRQLQKISRRGISGYILDKRIYPNLRQSNLQGEINAMKKRNVVIRCLVLLMMIAVFAGYASTANSESTGEYVDDSVITTKVKALLANDNFLKSFQISVETQKGVVQLSGFVDSKSTVNKAGQIASSVKGVSSVKNDLIVK